MSPTYTESIHNYIVIVSFFDTIHNIEDQNHCTVIPTMRLLKLLVRSCDCLTWLNAFIQPISIPDCNSTWLPWNPF